MLRPAAAREHQLDATVADSAASLAAMQVGRVRSMPGCPAPPAVELPQRSLVASVAVCSGGALPRRGCTRPPRAPAPPTPPQLQPQPPNPPTHPPAPKYPLTQTPNPQRSVEERSSKLHAAEERCYALEHEVDGLAQRLAAAGEHATVPWVCGGTLCSRPTRDKCGAAGVADEAHAGAPLHTPLSLPPSQPSRSAHCCLCRGQAAAAGRGGGSQQQRGVAAAGG